MLECKLGPPFTIGIYLYDIGIYIAELKGWVSLGFVGLFSQLSNGGVGL